MHLEKFMLWEIFRYERQKNAIIDVLDISGKNNNKWLWHNGEKLDDV